MTTGTALQLLYVDTINKQSALIGGLNACVYYSVYSYSISSVSVIARELRDMPSG